MQDESKSVKGMSRRAFLNNAALTAAGIAIVPRHVLGGKGFMAPSDKLNIAVVGVGGMGNSNLRAVSGTENIVALCDVDYNYAARIFKLHPNAKTYKDYRRMLDEQKDIDAVMVATPDHTHAVITLAAMDLGKHVYTQKPLTHSIHEARALANKAKESGVVTQMGNQGHSSDDARRINEWIRQGAIGDVTEVHVWTNRPVVYWGQGVPAPAKSTTVPPETGWNKVGLDTRLAHAMAGNYPVPEGLDWDLFLGPSPQVDYHPVYHPFNWRGWVNWGTGAIGDMGAHLIDHPFWALDLQAPTTIETRFTPFNRASFPLATTTYFEFPARGNMPPVKMNWYDGGLLPPRPDELEPGEKVNPDGGVMYYGTKGKLMHETYGSNPRIFPKSLAEQVGEPKQEFARVANGSNGHEMNWVNTIKGTDKISSPIEYGGPLTETMLLGLVSLMVDGQKIEWDSKNMRVTNIDEANQYVSPEYRKGWSL